MAAAAKTVVEALSAVMGDVQAVGKKDRNTMQNYNFRGVDAVVNAVGPALRKHGVVVVPSAVTYEDERYQTAKGAQMRGVTAIVTFRFYGPAGDYIDAQVAGESSDAGDKAMPKAHSVAYRTLLLEALCIPTDEPDPDTQSHERQQNGSAGRTPAQEMPGGASTSAGPPQGRASATDGNQPPPGVPPIITKKQLDRLHAIAGEAKCPEDEQKRIVAEIAGVKSRALIPVAKYDAVITAIEAHGLPF